MNGFFPSSTIQKDVPTGLIAKCGACQLYKHCESPKMVPHGEGRKGVLVLGEAPGKIENIQGRPFVGEAGKFLRKELSKLGIKLDRDALTTNALICHPPHNATPDAKQISYCHPNLLKTIRDFQPRVILTLGRTALVSALKGHWEKVRELDHWIGWKIPLEKFWVCPTYHPAYLLRMKNTLMDRLFSNHLQAAFEIHKDPPPQEDWSKRIELVWEDKKVHNILREMDEAGGWVAVDYETNCLKPEWPKAQAFSFAVSNGERTIAYPWNASTMASTQKFLASGRTKKVASNMKMEERWTKKLFGHGVNNWGWDTMLAAHCLDNRPGICSLKFQAFIKMGVRYNETIEPYLKSADGPYNRIQEIDPAMLLFYNGMDAILEHRLAMIQRKEMGYD